MYQTVTKIPCNGDVSITYHKAKMTPAERKALKKYGVKIVTHRKMA